MPTNPRPLAFPGWIPYSIRSHNRTIPSPPIPCTQPSPVEFSRLHKKPNPQKAPYFWNPKTLTHPRSHITSKTLNRWNFLTSQSLISETPKILEPIFIQTFWTHNFPSNPIPRKGGRKGGKIMRTRGETIVKHIWHPRSPSTIVTVALPSIITTSKRIWHLNPRPPTSVIAPQALLAPSPFLPSLSVPPSLSIKQRQLKTKEGSPHSSPPCWH